jgi:hypothetical protein
MAGARVDMPINGATDWSSFVDIVQLMMESYFSVSLTNMENNSEPLLESIGFVVVKGTVYKFVGDETITGWSGISNSTEAYIYIVSSGATCTAVWSSSAPAWDSDYQGYYNGNDRCVGGAYRDGSGNCTKKWLAYNSTRGVRGSATNRQRLIRSDIEPDAVGDQELDLGVASNQVDGDVVPLGSAVTSSPTGGTPTSLANSSFLRAAVQEVLDRLRDMSGVQNVAVVNRHLGNNAVRQQELDLGVDAGDVDADVVPLGQVVASNPTGGTATSLPAASFIRAALVEIFARLKNLSGVQNDAVLERHIGFDLDDVPNSTYQKVHGTYVDGSGYIDSIKEVNGTRILVKVITIGDWTIASAAEKTIAHGLSTRWKYILDVQVVIRNDSDDMRDTFETPVAGQGGTGQTKASDAIWIKSIDATNIILNTDPFHFPANTEYDGTGFSRGYLTIWYIP